MYPKCVSLTGADFLVYFSFLLSLFILLSFSKWDCGFQRIVFCFSFMRMRSSPFIYQLIHMKRVKDSLLCVVIYKFSTLSWEMRKQFIVFFFSFLFWLVLASGSVMVDISSGLKLKAVKMMDIYAKIDINLLRHDKSDSQFKWKKLWKEIWYFLYPNDVYTWTFPTKNGYILFYSIRSFQYSKFELNGFQQHWIFKLVRSLKIAMMVNHTTFLPFSIRESGKSTFDQVWTGSFFHRLDMVIGRINRTNFSKSRAFSFHLCSFCIRFLFALVGFDVLIVLKAIIISPGFN